MSESKREVWVLEAVEPTLFQVPAGTPLAASPDREQLLRLGDNVHRYVPASSTPEPAVSVACSALARAMGLPADHPQGSNIAWLAGRAVALLEPAAADRAAWAVRVLDAWAYRPGFSGAWNNTRNEMVSNPDDEFMVELIEDGSDDDTNYYLANTPDAARIAAAEALVAASPALSTGFTPPIPTRTPDMAKHGLKDLIEALTIFSKYGNGGYAPTNCSHDVFTVCDGITEDAVSDEDKARLEELGFDWSSERDAWYSFRFGSC